MNDLRPADFFHRGEHLSSRWNPNL